MIPIIILVIEDDNDREYMANVYIQYRWLMYSEVKKIIGDPEATEDTLQDVLVKLIDKVALLKTLDKKRLASYVAEASKNTARNYLRGKHKVPLSLNDLEDYQDAGKSVEHLVIDHISMDELNKIWSQLKEESRDLLSMKYLLMQSNQEIAIALGIKPESVRMKLTRARREALSLLSTEGKGLAF